MKKALAVLLVMVSLLSTTAGFASIEYSEKTSKALTEIYDFLLKECGAPSISFAGTSIDGVIFINLYGDKGHNLYFITMASEQFTLIFWAESLIHANSVFTTIQEELSKTEITEITEVHIMTFNLLTGESQFF